MVTMFKIVGISAVISATLLSAIGATAQKSSPSSKLYLDRVSDRPVVSSVILSAWTGPEEESSATTTTDDAPRWIVRPTKVELRGAEIGSSTRFVGAASFVTASR